MSGCGSRSLLGPAGSVPDRWGRKWPIGLLFLTVLLGSTISAWAVCEVPEKNYNDWRRSKEAAATYAKFMQNAKCGAYWWCREVRDRKALLITCQCRSVSTDGKLIDECIAKNTAKCNRPKGCEAVGP